MSGGGGGGGGGGGPVIDITPCERVKFEVQLTSPQPTVVATISVGEVLDVVLTPRQAVLVIEAQKNGVAVGGIAGLDAARLRACLTDGHPFKATVLAVNGGQVRVKVEHA